MIVVLKDRSALRHLRALCAASADEAPECRLPAGLCRRLYATTVAGVAGSFEPAHVEALHSCLPAGSIAYVEQDGLVLKAEVHDGSHDRWWEAQQQPPSSAPAVAAMDDAPAASGIGRRAAGGESAAGAAQVSSTDEQAEQEAANSARSRWLLANAGLEAQALLAGGAAPVTAFSPAAYVPDPKYANVTVNPADLSSPGYTSSGLQALDGPQLVQAISQAGLKLQRLPAALWNLDRIDQRGLPLNRQYGYGSDSSAGTGKGVTIYTVDSGVNPSHQEFQSWVEGAPSRAAVGIDLIDDDDYAADCDGHGTHIASSAIGRAVGVAKEASVVAVRVLDCEGNGSISDVVAALDWVANNAVHPAVVTMSLGVATGSWSRALEEAVRSLVVDHNITVVVAAGNSAVDSCSIAPARVPEAISVGASNLAAKYGLMMTPGVQAEDLYRWSNTGACVDIFAPGVDIYAACGGARRCEAVNDEAYTFASGTSMAVPHVAGAVAIYLADHPTATPAEVRAALLRSASNGMLSSAQMLPNTRNSQLFTGVLASPSELAALPPLADEAVGEPSVVQLSEPVAAPGVVAVPRPVTAAVQTVSLGV